MEVKNIMQRHAKWQKIFVGTLATVLILGIGSILVVRKVYHQNLQPASASQHSRIVSVPLGSSPHTIAVLLQQKGIIRSSWAFEWYIRSHEVQDQLKAGSYELRPSQAVADIVNVLTNGKIATNLVTILPAQRIDQIQRSLVNAGFSEADVTAALNPANYPDHPALVDKPAGASLEGYLYPESFQKTAATSPKEIVHKSLDEMQKRLTPDIRNAFTRNGLSVHQGIILASIVEQEVSTTGDRGRVAQVFYSRMRQNMPLQSDVTAFYGAHVNGQPNSTSYDSPYNTYLHPGLPAGPISNVSQSSLQAVAFPAATDFLYFVAGDDGVTHFSHTQAEHEALVKQYCHKLCSGQ
ncbi:MAG: Endolytic murein transglycosylase [Candidatus Saccharibacteria bacterium]|nr:Endolytic murein transglycosylase [Candidatus Saccharibacteria bacterium]